MESEESGKLRALRSLLPHAAWLLRALVLHELSCPICFHALYASSLLCSYAIRAFVIHVASVTCLVPRILCHVPRVYVLLSHVPSALRFPMSPASLVSSVSCPIYSHPFHDLQLSCLVPLAPMFFFLVCFLAYSVFFRPELLICNFCQRNFITVFCCTYK